MLFARVSRELDNDNKGDKSWRIVEECATMSTANQTRGMKSIAQLTDQDLPKRIYEPALGQ